MSELVGRAPDYHEPFVGWRVWLLKRERGREWRLQSIFYDTIWPERTPFHAICLQRFGPWPGSHRAPTTDCECGIYAARDPECLTPYVESRRWWRRERLDRVLGLVSLWGDVLACERGWRASHAYPARVYVPVRDTAQEEAGGEAVRVLARAYGVPVELLRLGRGVGALDLLGQRRRAA